MRLALAVLTAAAAPTPAKLLQQIATEPWPKADLPAHVTIGRVGAVPVSAQGRKYHAIGEILFILKGPNPNDELVFEVFPSARDANGDIQHPHLNPNDRKHGQALGVPNSLLVTTSGMQNGKRIGITIVAAVRGNVIVQAVTSSTTKAKQGDTAEAIALMKAALAHLKKLAETGGPSA
jgi:hypothetical protein